MSIAARANHNVGDTLAATRVAILGLGLMGGSLAMALRGKCGLLIGYDPDPEVIQMALTRKIIDIASTEAAQILPQADLLVLAAPVKQILVLLGRLDLWHPGPATIMDLGSTKRQVIKAMLALPARFDPIGGHPICGKEKFSLSHAEPDLYDGAAFVLCRLPRTSDLAIRLAGELIRAVGAHPVYLEAGEHDRWIAATSHLPYLLANALAAATPLEAATLVGPGYRSATRLAASYAPMLLDVLETNQDMVLSALQAFHEALDRIESGLQAGDWQAIARSLQASAQRQAALIQDLTIPAGSGSVSS